MPQKFLILQLEWVEYLVFAFTLELKAVKNLRLLMKLGVFDVLLDHFELVVLLGQRLDLAREALVLGVSWVLDGRRGVLLGLLTLVGLLRALLEILRILENDVDVDQ